MKLIATTATELDFWQCPDSGQIYLLDSNGQGRFFCTDACWRSGQGEDAAKRKYPDIVFTGSSDPYGDMAQSLINAVCGRDNSKPID
jgi:hypothetical protein